MRGKGTDQQTCRLASDEMSFLIFCLQSSLLKRNPRGRVFASSGSVYLKPLDYDFSTQSAAG